mmetsp:Transcript_25517/g.84350  ORF Transcript_25517/g.84350 Transcript_25517/m.84350 type:complete len:80 (+) Transcript_25517:1424-1663(+)
MVTSTMTDANQVMTCFFNIFRGTPNLCSPPTTLKPLQLCCKSSSNAQSLLAHDIDILWRHRRIRCVCSSLPLLFPRSYG